MPMDWQWGDLFDGQAMQTWIRIVQWIWAFSILWIGALLFRGGFVDIDEIVRSRHATRAERWQARIRKPVRAIALVGASVFGATSFALPLWFQGAVVIVIWRQVSAG